MTRPPRTAPLADAYLPRHEGAVTVARGRTLGYAEFGVADGIPVLWFPGTPGARRQVPLLARRWAASHGLRLVAVERPGTGASTPHLYHSISEFADDIAVLADVLGLPRFGLVGLSGGGPYVLACAARLPQRVIAAAVFGGVAPTLGPEAVPGGLVHRAVAVERWLALLRKPLGTVLSRGVRALHPLADPIFDAIVRYGPATESAVLGELEMRAMFVDDILLGSRIGLHSVLSDLILFARPWGFHLTDIRVPVHFWQGTDDLLVPPEHAQAQAALIPGAAVTVCEGKGHLAGLEHTVDALAFIVGHAGRRRRAKKAPTGGAPTKRAARRKQAAPVRRTH